MDSCSTAFFLLSFRTHSLIHTSLSPWNILPSFSFGNTAQERLIRHTVEVHIRLKPHVSIFRCLTSTVQQNEQSNINAFAVPWGTKPFRTSWECPAESSTQSRHYQKISGKNSQIVFSSGVLETYPSNVVSLTTQEKVRVPRLSRAVLSCRVLLYPGITCI